jgi:uncharacterized protein
MKTAILIHGWSSKEGYFNPTYPAPSNAHWFPWIQRKLLLNNIIAQTPEMPDSYEPDYEKWRKMFERFDPDKDTILVGHSCGGGFLVRWLSENKIKVGKVVLVAPWLDPDHELKSDFFKFEIDKDLTSRTAGLTIMYSTDDSKDITESMNTLRSNLGGVRFQEFTDKGHFIMESMKTEEFPELLANLI